MSNVRTVLVMIVLVMAGGFACSSPLGESEPSPVEIELELGGGQHWTASDASVVSRAICDGGSHRWVGYRKQDGSPIAYGEAEAVSGTRPSLVLIETQLGCSDGTGAISIAWDPDGDDWWIVVDGTGAYLGTTGGGGVVVGDSGQFLLEGEVSKG